MELELEEALGRPIEPRTPEDLSPYFRDEVTATSRPLYAACLRHLREAATKAISYSEGEQRTDLDDAELLRLALTKLGRDRRPEGRRAQQVRTGVGGQSPVLAAARCAGSARFGPMTRVPQLMLMLDTESGS